MNYYQPKTLHKLKQQIDLIILNSDKNIGPVLIKRMKYISIILNQFLPTNMFIQIKNNDIRQQLTIQKDIFMDIYWRLKKLQLNAGKAYLFRALQLDNIRHMRIPQLYGTVKGH